MEPQVYYSEAVAYEEADEEAKPLMVQFAPAADSIDRIEGAAAGGETATPVAIRKDFPETWIFDSIDGYDHTFSHYLVFVFLSLRCY